MRGRLPESRQGANVRHRAGQWVSRGWRELVGWIVRRLSDGGASVLRMCLDGPRDLGE